MYWHMMFIFARSIRKLCLPRAKVRGIRIIKYLENILRYFIWVVLPPSSPPLTPPPRWGNRSRGLWTQKLKTYLLRTQSSKVLLLKPGVGLNTAKHASFTARDFFLQLISTLPVHSTAFFQNLSQVFPVLSVANMGSCEGLQNKTDNPVFVLLYLWACSPKLSV